MTATEYVVLVNDRDQEIGLAEKLDAHQRCLLHRAFSIFIFRDNKLLLQQRALSKYHSAGLWTNTCCSHPRQNEDMLAAGSRRLKEELGLVATLKDIGTFHYTAHFANNLSENEIDHVLVGTMNEHAVIAPNPEEIMDTRWITLEDLTRELTIHPEHFTPWLQQALDIVLLNKWKINNATT